MSKVMCTVLSKILEQYTGLIFLYIDYINCDSIICVRLKKERKNEMSNLEYY